jgi:GNAT superfamily N-acetyltransferase
MEAIDLQPIRPIDEGDLAGAQVLSAAAGWNQTVDDWRMMVRNGAAVGCRNADGNLIASALALPFGGRFGWISMVLVAAEWRRRGIATRLVEHGVDWLESRAMTALLDATPDGAKVYRGMGFRTVARITRWQCDGRRPGGIVEGFPEVTPATLPQVLNFDREVFGADRAFVVRDMLSRSGARALVAAEPARGFLLTRCGRLATQIGPLCADREGLAIALTDAALARIDDHQTTLVQHLKTLGFTLQRPFERMVRGQADFGFPSARYFAVAGPELG